jgi:hypothetical protein
MIIGCDFHTRYQQIAMMDEATGELTEAGGAPFLFLEIIHRAVPPNHTRVHSGQARSVRVPQPFVSQKGARGSVTFLTLRAVRAPSCASFSLSIQ